MRQLEIKVLDIVDARCSHEEQHKVYKRYVDVGSVFVLLAISIIYVSNVNFKLCELVQL